jgi:hypothetical protein
MNPNRLIPLVAVFILITSIFIISWMLIDYDSNPEMEVYQARDRAIVFPSVETFNEINQEHKDYSPEKRQSLLPDLIKSGSLELLSAQRVKLLGKEGQLLKIETDEGDVWYTTQDQLDHFIDEPE